ncbi:FGGY-family carbohydrate kinase [Treponema sp.]
MSTYFLGIDNGGTLTKAVLFDAEGKEVAGASRKVPMENTPESYSERDMEKLWQANLEVIAEALQKAIQKQSLKGEQVRGIACTGHGKGLYLWGKEGKPAYNGIISTDTRAWAEAEAWHKDGTADRVRAKTFQSILASQPVSLLAWFKKHKPEILENTQWIFEAKDYIRFRLTGEAYAEITDYSGSSLMNLKEARFEKPLLDEFGLGDLLDKLPPIKYSTESCGSVTAEVAAATGLKEGTPVAGGMFDIDACAVAMDVTDDEKLCIIAGTWSINEYVADKPVMDNSILMNSLFCLPGKYLVEECSPTSAGNNEWFTEFFLDSEKREAAERGLNIYAYADELAATVGPADQNIIFLPYIYGSNYNPRAKACFIGLDTTHTRAQLIRSVLEGIAFCHRVHVDKLKASRKETKAARLAGGAANSMLWAQIFADVLGLSIELIETKELGTLGCAMAAAVAAGVYPDLKSAANKMVKVKARIEPDPEAVAIYEKKYERYLKISQALDGLWGEF